MHRGISPDEADRWLAHFRSSLGACGAEPTLQDEVIALLRPAAHRLTNHGAPYERVRAAVAMAGRGDLTGVQKAVAENPGVVDQRAGDGVTMLWEASRRGRMPVVQWLTEQGASFEIPGTHQHAVGVMVSPLCIAIRNRRPSVAAYLWSQGAVLDVFSAAYLGDLKTLTAILDADAAAARAESPEEDFYPVTPLHHAVDGGSIAAAKLLLARGAEVAPFAARLLTSAARQDSLELVRTLLDHGAAAVDAENLGALDGSHAIANLLIERGLNLDKPIRGRETYLTLTCRGDKGHNTKAIRALLLLGANPNAPNGSGRTPLHAAARAG